LFTELKLLNKQLINYHLWIMNWRKSH